MTVGGAAGEGRPVFLYSERRELTVRTSYGVPIWYFLPFLSAVTRNLTVL